MKNAQTPNDAKPTTTDILARCQTMLATSASSEELLEILMQLLGQDLIEARLHGQPVYDALNSLNCLLRYVNLKARSAALRAREHQTEVKAATLATRLQKSARSTARAQTETAASAITSARPSLDDAAYLESILEQYGYLPKERPDRKNSDFNIDSQLIAFPYADADPLLAKAK